jgi:hypothetical protein
MSANPSTALVEAEVHLGELATGPKAGRPDYVGVLSLADAVALRDELARLRTRVAVLSSAASPAQEATPPREEQHQGWTKKAEPTAPNQPQEPPTRGKDQ